MEILAMIGGFAIALVIYLLLREVMCWYYKLNDILKELKDMNKKLGSLSLSPQVMYNQNNPNNIDGNINPIEISEIDIPFLKDGEDPESLYILQTDSQDKAFCRGCMTTVPKKELYYKEKTNTYYHDKCAPDKSFLRK